MIVLDGRGYTSPVCYYVAMHQTPPWYVLTGAPSSGKSTLLAALAARGYRTQIEAARHVIEREVARGRDLLEMRHRDAAAFQHEVLQLKLEWEAELPHDQIVFFDRGIPDSVAYYRHENIPEDVFLRDAIAKARYRRVFVLDLISRENFVLDGARSETWAGAQELDQLLESAYRELGYDVMRVPAISVDERADFVLKNL